MIGMKVKLSSELHPYILGALNSSASSDQVATCFRFGYTLEMQLDAFLKLSLFELKLIVEIGCSRSLREAARQFELKPAHLSKIVQKMEQNLGRALFVRSAQGMTPTPEAKEMIKVAEEILELAQSLSSPRHRKDLTPQLLGFGAVSFLMRAILVPCLSEIAKEQSRYRFRLLELRPQDLVADGLAGGFELGLHLEPLDWPKTWTSFEVGKISFKLYGRPGHAVGVHTNERALQFQKFIVPVYWSHDRFLTGTDQCPLSISKRMRGHETATADAAAEFASFTDELVFLPEPVARNLVIKGRLETIEVVEWPKVERSLFLTVKASQVSQRFVRTFLDVCRKYVS